MGNKRMIRVLFNYQKSLGRKLLGFYYKIYLRSSGCKVGRNFKCLGLIHFREVPNGNFIIGDNVAIGRNCTFEITPSGKLILEDNSVIGDNVMMSSLEKIRVGRWTGIAENVSIRDAFHLLDKGSLYQLQGSVSQPIDIGEDVVLGAGTAVLKGAVIPNGVIVGSNSVVTGNSEMEAFGIYAGQPARLIKLRS